MAAPRICTPAPPFRGGSRARGAMFVSVLLALLLAPGCLGVLQYDYMNVYFCPPDYCIGYRRGYRHMR